MINEIDILINNEIKVTSPRSSWWGQTGVVRKVMADDRTLEVKLHKHGEVIFIDASLVSEIQEPVAMPKGEPNLGPDANSVLPSNRM
jgi:hypothetical protein